MQLWEDDGCVSEASISRAVSESREDDDDDGGNADVDDDDDCGAGSDDGDGNGKSATHACAAAEDKRRCRRLQTTMKKTMTMKIMTMMAKVAMVCSYSHHGVYRGNNRKR